MIDNPPDPLDRIRNSHLVEDLLTWAASVCGMGSVVRTRVCDVGYDDCNIALDTAGGPCLVKIFTSGRTEAMARRYVGVIESVIDAGVRHPRLYRAGGQALLWHAASGNFLIVMEYVDGATFFDLKACPDDAELALLVDQVHRLHAIDLVPDPVHDWWAIPNIATLCAEIGPALTDDERELAGAAALRLSEVDVPALPHALVHGDLTKTNVMRRAGGGITVLDFAVANRYPRVHELAMIAVNLLHGHPLPLPDRAEALADLYHERSPLTAAERRALPPYVAAAAAMELLGAKREWVLKGNRSEETRYLLELGRTAVREAVL
jgi:Ser/Thr protein kinase RdoA (MazF antagonist)